MSARHRVVLALVLLVLAVIVQWVGNPLSGATVLALVLAFVALDVVVPVFLPETKKRGSIEDAVELLDAERGAR